MSLFDIDLLVFKFIHYKISNPFFDFLLPILRNKLTWIPLYLYWVIILIKKNKKRVIPILLFAIILIILCDNSCARILKPLIERNRPCDTLAFTEWFRNLGHCSNTFSFPSCHATNHSAIAVFIAYFLNHTWIKYLVLWVIIICISQIYIGVHYPIDIIGGIILGSVLGFLIKKIYIIYQKRMI